MIKIFIKFFDSNVLKMIAINVLMGLIPVLSVYFLTQLIDVIVERTSFEHFVFSALGLIGCIVLAPLLNDYSKIVVMKLNQKIKGHLLIKINKYYGEHDILKLQSSNMQNKLSLVTNFDEDVIGLYQASFSLIKNTMTFTGTLVLVIHMQPLIIFIMITASIISLLISRYIGSLQFTHSMELIEDQRLNEKKTHEIKYSKNQSQIYSYKVFNYLFSEWARHFDYIVQKNIKQLKIIAKVNVFSELVLTLAFLTVCYLIWLSGTVVASKVVLTLQSLGNFQSSISQLGDSYITLRELKRKTDYIEDFLVVLFYKDESQQEIFEKQYPYHVRIKKMIFSYPNKKNIVYLKQDVIWNSGEVIGIIGANGEGKSTFISCLIGHYEAETVQIDFGSHQIDNSIALKEYMKNHTAILNQWNFRIVGTAIDNLFVELDLMKKTSFKLVNEFKNLLHGIEDRVLDLEFGNGVELSGGQWQHLFLVRLFMQEKTIYILDEPTNHLDDGKVKMLINDINLLKKQGKIIIVISHDSRLSEIYSKTYQIKNGDFNMITERIEVGVI